MIALGQFFFRYRRILFPAVALPLALVAPPRLLGGDPRWDLLLDAVGIALIACGQAVRMLVIGLAYIKRGGKDGRIYADGLVDAGIYAHCRNPMYFGNLLVICGIAVMFHSPWFYLLAVPFFFFAYLAIVLAEEAYLAPKFGDAYADYCRRVPRFVPSVRGLRRTLEGMRFDWRKVIRKEYGTIFGTISGVLAILIWERLANFGFAASRREIELLALAWLPVIGAFGVARFLKLTGRLKEPAVS